MEHSLFIPTFKSNALFGEFIISEDYQGYDGILHWGRDIETFHPFFLNNHTSGLL
jgi:hypothetical protein